MAEAYREMGYEVINVGQNDLAFGVNFLKKVASNAQLTLISTNLYDATTGEPLFQKSYVCTVGGHKVGVLGILHQRGLNPNQH